MTKTISLTIALLLASYPALAAVPQRVLYQGTLRQAGALYTGNATFLFRLTDSGGGVEYWNSGSTDVVVTSGLFRYPLGIDNPGTGGTDESATFLTIDWSNIAPYVEVTVNGNLLAPREEMHSVPYAIFNSAAVDNVNPRVMRSGDTMTGQLTLSGSTLTVTGDAFSVGGSTLVVADGMVGVGLTSPASKLDVRDGDIRISTTAGQPSRGVIFQDGTTQTTSALGGNLWADRGSNEISNTNTGNVGVGIVNPSFTLDVFGAANVAETGGFFQAGSRVLSSTNTNTYVGMDAGLMNLAGGLNNVFVGSGAGDDNTTGDSNTFVGYGAGDANATGIRNTFIGSNAGASNISGDRNVFLGYQAGFSETNSDKLYLDNSNTASPLLWGDFSTNVLNVNGSLGIGPTNPGTKLHVSSGVVTVDGAGAAINVWGSSVNASAFFGDGSNLTGITGGANRVLKAGDTMTGALVLPADPTTALEAATKQYVDSWTRPCVNPGDAADIMVPVGDLCVDKYETSVWSTATGGTQYGIDGAADYPCGNGATGTGQTCAAAGTRIYARSVAGVKPSTSITWFQANIACANAGKHLLTNAEWQAAAAGTPDPGAGGVAPACITGGAASGTTGTGGSCLSSYGVENMIGSVWEWVADWGQYGMFYTGADPNNWADGTFTNAHLPAGYNADGSWNVAGRSINGSAWATGLPAAVIRGGRWVDGANAGVFAFFATGGPSNWYAYVGLRCGRRR